MLTRHQDAPVDPGRLVVVRLTVAPQAIAAQRPGYPVPDYADTGLEFVHVLRMDMGPVFERPFDAILGAHRSELVGDGPPWIAAQQNGWPI